MSEPHIDGREPRREAFVQAHSAERKAIRQQFPTMRFPGPEPAEHLRLGPQLELMKYALMWAETHAPELYTELDRIISLMHPYVRLQYWDTQSVDNAVTIFTDRLADDNTLAQQEDLFVRTLQKNPQVLQSLPGASIGVGVVHLHALIEAMHATEPTNEPHLNVADLGPTAGLLTTLSRASYDRVMANPVLKALQGFAPYEWAARANESSSVTHWVERLGPAMRQAQDTDLAVYDYVKKYLQSTIRLLTDSQADRARTRHELSVIVRPEKTLQESAVALRMELDGLVKELDTLHFNIKFSMGHSQQWGARSLANVLTALM